jgi:hypothetical protein
VPQEQLDVCIRHVVPCLLKYLDSCGKCLSILLSAQLNHDFWEVVKEEHGEGLFSQQRVDLFEEGREDLAFAREVSLLPLFIDIVLHVVNQVFKSVSPCEHQLVNEEVLVMEGERLEEELQVWLHLIIQQRPVQYYLEQAVECVLVDQQLSHLPAAGHSLPLLLVDAFQQLH